VARVHHLNCGTLCPAARFLVNGKGSLFSRGDMVCHCLLVETDEDGLILVDSGFGTADVANPNRFNGVFRTVAAPAFKQSETAIAQVRALGFDPQDVRHIVVTHLDLDHAGGLSDFPWAQVHLHAMEHHAAMARATAKERERYLAAQWAHKPSWSTYADAGDDFFGLSAVRRLDGVKADVALLPLFGHSRGHSGVAVKTGDRWLLHAGDAYFHRGEVKRRPPRCPTALRVFQSLVQVDGSARLSNQERLRELHARNGHDVWIFSAHDPVELERARSAP